MTSGVAEAYLACSVLARPMKTRSGRELPRSLEIADPTLREAKVFRRGLRVRYEFFQQLVELVKER